MAFENPFSSPSENDKERPDNEKQAESSGEEFEESVGKHASEYKDAAGVSHSTYSLREGLDKEMLKKLEKMRGSDQDDEEDTGEMKKAA